MAYSQAGDQGQDDVGATSAQMTKDRARPPREAGNPTYPGIEAVIHGNGAVAYVMGHVCGGVIGYPITPSTEISELFEAYRAKGGCNVWGKHPFFFEPEGEHSAQSGALGATLTGGRFMSNASSSQGILYALESHYVTVGKKAGGFVLQVAARAVSRALAQRHGRARRCLCPVVIRLHDPVRQQPAGGGRPRGDRLSSVSSLSMVPGCQCNGWFRDQPHAERGAACRNPRC